MPFLKEGAQGIVYTKKYLEAGRILFKDNVKIFTMNHIPDSKISDGANKFLIWKLPQLQFKNPKVVTFKDITPTPFIKCYLEDTEEILIDISFRDQHAIENHLIDILCKKKMQVEQEQFKNQVIVNPANFGRNYPRQCICEIYGQVPCSSMSGPPSVFKEIVESKCKDDVDVS